MALRNATGSLRFRAMRTPFGWLRLAARGDALTVCSFADEDLSALACAPSDDLFRAAQDQLTAYFEGNQTPFCLPCAPEGTLFQRRVWEALGAIPFGRTQSYRDVAQAMGMPGAARAVGQANGRNPLCLFVPCHRVIAQNGGIGGYSAGLWRKTALLALERRRSDCDDLIHSPVDKCGMAE